MRDRVDCVVLGVAESGLCERIRTSVEAIDGLRSALVVLDLGLRNHRYVRKEFVWDEESIGANSFASHESDGVYDGTVESVVVLLNDGVVADFSLHGLHDVTNRRKVITDGVLDLVKVLSEQDVQHVMIARLLHTSFYRLQLVRKMNAMCSVALFGKYACTPTTGRENFSRPVGAHQTSRARAECF